MPIITLEAGKLTREQKLEFVQEVTETTHKITGIRKESIIVVIKENDPENIGSGGELLADKLK